MSLPRLRRRADAATFAAWRGAVAGVGLPAWFELGPVAGEGAVTHTTRGVTMPPLVGAAFRVHTDPQSTVLLAVRDGTSITIACVAVGDDVVSALARRVEGDADTWFEVALVPVERMVEEVLRWVPARPGGDATLDVRVVRRRDAVAGWMERWAATAGQGWAVTPPGTGPAEPAMLAARLRCALADSLAGHGAAALAAREAG